MAIKIPKSKSALPRSFSNTMTARATSHMPITGVMVRQWGMGILSGPRLKVDSISRWSAR